MCEAGILNHQSPTPLICILNHQSPLLKLAFSHLTHSSNSLTTGFKQSGGVELYTFQSQINQYNFTCSFSVANTFAMFRNFFMIHCILFKSLPNFMIIYMLLFQLGISLHLLRHIKFFSKNVSSLHTSLKYLGYSICEILPTCFYIFKCSCILYVATTKTYQNEWSCSPCYWTFLN